MKKVLPYIFIVIILIGLISPLVNVRASVTNPTEPCNSATSPTNQPCTPVTAPAPTTPPKEKANLLEANLTSCNIMTRFDACIVLILYYVFYSIPSLLVTLTGKILNAVLIMALNSGIYSMDFITTTWGIVRDISNIFFILILLYIAIQMILDIGGHGAKKMIAQVIIMALLINFSMFFTKVVIDASNILALVFYNKITVSTTVDGQPTDYDRLMSPNENDVSGGIFSKLDPTSVLTQGFFDALRDNNGFTGRIKNMSALGLGAYVATGAGAGALATAWTGPGALLGGAVGGTLGAISYLASSLFGKDDIPAPIMAGLIVVCGLILMFSIYAFMIAALAFVGRMLELWILIIFSPFAFMSFAIPEMAKLEYLGWDNWSKRLLSISFMAPIFMFFMYFISLVVGSNMWVALSRPGEKNALEIMILIALPALFLLILLLKAADFAKKGSGVLGDMLMKGATMVGGLALGAATGGTALALTSTVGKRYQNIANDDELKAKAAAGDRGAQKKLAHANAMANKSFDFRQTSMGKFAAKKTGLDLAYGTGAIGLGTDKFKDGAQGMAKREAEKADKTRKTYMLSGTAAEKQEERAKQYEDDKTKAQAWAEANSRSFTEEDFRYDYEKGKSMAFYGLDKTVAGGTIKTTKEINDERQKAYSISRDNGTQHINAQKERAKQYEADKATAQAWSQENNTSFIENDFKKDYENGGNMAAHGLEKVVKGGSVESVSGKEQARKAVSRFWDTYKEGVGATMTSKTGVATMVAAGAVTGGLGAAVTPLVGGLVHVIKKGVQEGFGKSTNAELATKIRTGVKTSLEDAFHHMQEAAGGGHHEPEAGHDDHGAAAHATPAAAQPAHATPAAGGGGNHGGGHH